MMPVESLTTARDTRDDEIARARRIAAEMRAAELVQILRDAVAGGQGWRLRARQLLVDIDIGRLP